MFELITGFVLPLILIIIIPILMILRIYHLNKKLNSENEISKEIVYHFNTEKEYSLNDMIEYHKQNGSIKYNINYDD